MSSYREQIAKYVVRISYEDISTGAREALKQHFLDSLGCAINALTWEPIQKYQQMIESNYNPTPHGKCTLIGWQGIKAAPQISTLWNGGLMRYVDFMDGYMAAKQSCHPSDNIAPIMSACEAKKDQSGKDFLTALGIAYNVHCKITDSIPASKAGFDHTVQLGISIAAGASKALGLDLDKTSNAIGLAAASCGGLDISRSGYLSNWKGLASAEAGFRALNCAMLARAGITGPELAFEGPNGVFKAFESDFLVDWSKEDCERVLKCEIKEYNVELHDQSLIEGLFQLKEREGFEPGDIEKIMVETFKEANDVTGTGKLAGNKYDVRTKDQADHSIPYALAVSILDNDLYPEQYRPERISKQDVQTLLRKVTISENEKFTRLFPDKQACKLTIALKNGRNLTIEKEDYEGLFSKPMSIEKLIQKFRRISSSVIDQRLQDQIIDTILNLERKDLTVLLDLLGTISFFEAQTKNLKAGISADS